jgi:phenylpropionate dioxygenase-like ring-hydroxylating dioxygenase large terminal subunit
MAAPVFDFNRQWSLDYPELGTDPVPTEPCISPAYFELERERVFRKVWLYVGRQEEIPNVGDYFVRDLPACNTSVVIVRGKDGVIHAFHNICSHRGNKLVWEEGGSCRGYFSCKFHGWTYDTQGQLVNVPDEQMFHNFKKSENGLIPVAVDTWEGFIFINVDPKPQQTLHQYLGGVGKHLSGFPYGEMTARYAYKTELKCNWKIALDAFSEGYHVNVVHGRSYPDTFTGKNNPMCHLPEVRFYGPHRSCIVYGNPNHKPSPAAAVAYRFGETVTKRAGSLTQLPLDVNPTRSAEFGFDLDVIFPNLLLHILPGMWFTHQFWPLAVDRTLWEGRAYWPPARTPGERFAQEFNNVVLRTAWLEDTGTMEATHAALSSCVKTHFNLQDQEILIRHSYKVLEEYVGFYKEKRAAQKKRASISAVRSKKR